MNHEVKNQFPEVWAALMELRRRGVRSLEHTYQALLETVVPHLEWVDPWDHPPLTRSDDPREAFQGEVYRAFVGDDPEWVVAGTLARFDPTPALRDVAVPTLVITGRHDRVTTPSVAHAIADAFPNGRSRLVVFERSAHRPWIEETERYFAVVESLLAGRDARSSQTGQEQGGDR